MGDLEVGQMVYRGNSVSFIADKAKAYGELCSMAFAALRELGWDDDAASDNAERRQAVAEFARGITQRIAELERERDEARERVNQFLREWSATLRSERECLARIDGLTRERDEAKQSVWMLFNPDSVTTYEAADEWLEKWIETPDAPFDAARGEEER